MKRTRFKWATIVLITMTVGLGGILTAQSVRGLSTHAGGPVAGPLTQDLPPVTRGPMTTTTSVERATSVLSFDDGTCESGLGASGVTITSFVDFDVPTQCIQSGLDIVGLTARMNTGTATAFAFSQAGAAPPPPAAVVPVTLASAFLPLGPCPATAVSTRAIGPGAAVITGTANFFAGLVNNGFAGRDTDGAAAGRIWLNCSTCSNSQYSPTDIAGMGLGGNWMIRVTVEDSDCVPVELMQFSIE